MRKKWTKKNIKQGFNKFLKEYDRLPKACEIDLLPYLPSSHFMQKRFGGLELLREELGYAQIHFGKGSYRSAIATEAGLRSKQIGNDLKSELYTFYNQGCVQLEKTFSKKCRVDFYILTPEGNFGIDVFYAQTIRTLQSSINIKMKKFIEFKEPLYLTVANQDITQLQLNNYITNKKIPLPSNIHLVTLPTLRKHLKTSKTL